MKRFAILLITLLLFGSTVRAETATTSLQEMYAQAELLMVQGDYVGAAAKFEALSAYSDAAQMTLYCKAIYAADMGMYEMAVDALSSMGQFKDAPQLARYYTACSFLNCAETGNSMQMVDYEKYMQLWSESLIQSIKDPAYEAEPWDLVCCYWARSIFKELALYKDSMMKVAACDTLIQQKLDDIAAEAVAEKEKKYQEALDKESKGYFQVAANIYASLLGYKDCKERYNSCLAAIEAEEKEKKYQNAITLENNGNWEAAISIYQELGEYKDCPTRINSICVLMRDMKLVSVVEKQFKGGNSPFYTSETKYSYNKNGILQSIENKDDTLPYSEAIAVDENGKVVSGVLTGQWSSDPKYKMSVEKLYNEYGDVISEITTYSSYDNWFHKDGEVAISTYDYTYDEQGYAIQMNEYYDNKEYAKYRYVNTYDSNGLLIHMDEYENDKLKYRYDYEYNFAGMLITKIRDGEKSSITTEFSYAYEFLK